MLLGGPARLVRVVDNLGGGKAANMGLGAKVIDFWEGKPR